MEYGRKKKRLLKKQQRLMQALKAVNPSTPSKINFNQRAESSRDLGERSNAGHCSGVQCGAKIEIGGYEAKAATSGSNKKRLKNVGSSKAWKRNRRLQAQLAKINEELKALRRPSDRLANPRFL